MIFKSEAIPEAERLDLHRVIASIQRRGQRARILADADSIVDIAAPEMRARGCGGDSFERRLRGNLRKTSAAVKRIGRVRKPNAGVGVQRLMRTNSSTRCGLWAVLFAPLRTARRTVNNSLAPATRSRSHKHQAHLAHVAIELNAGPPNAGCNCRSGTRFTRSVIFLSTSTG